MPINTRLNYDLGKGVKYGDALKKSKNAREGGAYGMAGGFSVSGGQGGGQGQGKVKAEDMKAEEGMVGMASGDQTPLLKVQTLGGRIKTPEDGDPVYMLAAFRGGMYFFIFVVFVLRVLWGMRLTGAIFLQISYIFLRLARLYSCILSFIISMRWMRCPRDELGRVEKRARKSGPRRRLERLMSRSRARRIGMS